MTLQVKERYQNKNGKIDKNQLFDDIDQYTSGTEANPEAIVREFMRRFEE